MEKDLSKLKKKAAKVAVAAAIGAGVVVGSLYNNPEDLIKPEPIIAAEEDFDSASEEDAELNERKVSLRLRKWISALPLWIRAVIGLPFWVIGFLIITAFSALLSNMLNPAVSTAVAFLLVTAVLLVVMALMGKCLLPNIALRKFFNKKAIIIVISGVAIYALTDNVFSRIWEGYAEYSRTIMFITLTITLMTGLTQYYQNLRETKLLISADDCIYEQ